MPSRLHINHNAAATSSPPFVPIDCHRMTRHYAYLQVTGSGQPDAVAEALGMRATACHSDTDVNPRTDRPWGFMLWRLDSGEPDDAPLQQHVDTILLWLNRRPSAVKALGDEYDLTLHCACRATDTFGLHLKRDQTRLLGRLGVAIDYDGYVESAIDEDASHG